MSPYLMFGFGCHRHINQRLFRANSHSLHSILNHLTGKEAHEVHKVGGLLHNGSP